MLLEGRQVFCSAARQGSSFKPGFEPRRLFFCMQPAPIADICTLERCCSSFPALLLPLQDFTSAHKMTAAQEHLCIVLCVTAQSPCHCSHAGGRRIHLNLHLFQTLSAAIQVHLP